MNERDREIVNRLKSRVEKGKREFNGGINPYFIEEKVLPIIDRLDRQITEIREAGELFVDFYNYARPKDDEILIRHYKRTEGGILVDNYGRTIHGVNLRRLAKALEE